MGIFFILLCCLIAALGCMYYIQHNYFGYARTVSQLESRIRTAIVDTAESWLSSHEKDGGHRNIIDIYNSHTPLARDYPVQYDDEWCSTYASAVAIQCGMTEVIPTECG